MEYLTLFSLAALFVIIMIDDFLLLFYQSYYHVSAVSFIPTIYKDAE